MENPEIKITYSLYLISVILLSTVQKVILRFVNLPLSNFAASTLKFSLIIARLNY